MASGNADAVHSGTVDPKILEQARRLAEVARSFRVKVSSLMSNVLSRGRLNIPQFNALNALAMQGPINMTALAEVLRVSTAAATNVVDKLVHMGLVQRSRDEEDRRVVQVEATPKGRQTVADLEQDVTHFFTHLLAGLSEEEREQFVRLYERLNTIEWDEPLEVDS